jgi:isopentenyl diphosphate isomerase/L-lactate dehydrogenase-like FMN-dependent dehydrogenase
MRKGIWSVADMRREAERRVPKPLFELIDRGAGSEVTLRENHDAYDRIAIRPRLFEDVATVDTSTTLFGKRHSMPLLLAPVGGTNIARLHPSGEVGVAKGAVRGGLTFIVHQAPTYPIEAVAEPFAGAPVDMWAQLYLPANRDEAKGVVQRIERAGCPVLVLTVDNPVTPVTRWHNYRNRIATPTNAYPDRSSLVRMGLRYPRWMATYMQTRRAVARSRTPDRPFHENYGHDKPITLEDVRWVRDNWKGTLIIKGIQRADESDLLVSIGADGIVVSNHGARYLDTGQASVELLPEVVEAIGGRIEVYVDGGITRGTDILKALALGAKAVLIGKAYLYGLAVGGPAGVAAVIEMLRRELTEAMALAGANSIDRIDKSLVAMRRA